MSRLFGAVRFLTLVASLAALVAVGCPGPEPQLASTGGGGTSTTTTDGGSGGLGGMGTGGGTGGMAVGGMGTGGSAGCICDELDVLVVIDNSDAIDDFAPNLFAPFLQLANTVQEIAGRVCNPHIGVVTSRQSENNLPPCDTPLGALNTVNASNEACTMANGLYSTAEDILTTTVLCQVSVGTDGFGNETLLDAAIAALQPGINGANQCNDGFFRPSAPLLLMIISSVEDDDSAGDPEDWFNTLVALNGGDPDNIATLGLFGPVTAQGGCDADASPRLHSFVNMFGVDNRATVNICDASPMNLEEGAERMGEAVCPTR